MDVMSTSECEHMHGGLDVKIEEAGQPFSAPVMR
jgi:hypothetical protein